MTITIELPDDLAERLHALAAEAGQDINEFLVAAIRRYIERRSPSHDEAGEIQDEL